MKNDINQLSKLAVEIFGFDHTYYFSDDYRVWNSGENQKQQLIEKANTMDLSIGDKLYMITVFQNLWNDRGYGDFALVDENHIHWPYKSSMYSISGITKQDLLFSPIQ